MTNFVVVRERWVLKELLGLREDQATGMDELPARILRQCGCALARNVTALIRKMLALGRWPEMWKLHRVSPLYKKGAVYKPDNYRGLHLTPVLSKVAKRVIKIPFGNHVDAIDGFGASQKARVYRSGLTSGVLLALCISAAAESRRVP